MLKLILYLLLFIGAAFAGHNENEEWVDCMSSVCEPKTCDELGFPLNCTFLGTDYCDDNGGYICVQDHVRDESGRCIPKEDCPSCRGDFNATSGCGNCNKRCSTLNNTDIVCTQICDINGCNCKENYVYNEIIEKCVLPIDCPVPCDGDPFAVSKDCVRPSTCQPSCENRNPTPCTLCIVDGCECAPGYILDVPYGRCIKEENCPKTCPQTNEIWVDCLLGWCEPGTCNDVGYPVPCPGVLGPCDGGCVCDYGFVRASDTNNTCIPINQCPSCGGDRNATGGCGGYCGNLCSNYKDKDNISCPLICYQNSCDCKEGYVYNDIIEQCIKPEDCPIPCNGDPYAVSTPCNNICQPTCGFPSTKPCTNCHESGCQCADGYILDYPAGKCVRISSCPNDIGCNGDLNAQITDCGSYCSPVCEETIPIFCAAVCVRRTCECKPGYIYSKVLQGCVTLSECEQIKGWYTET